MLKFLLLVATRGSKTKRKGGTESGITEESPKALVMITAIEPFVKSELINRTLTVQFSKHLYNPSFIDDEATRQILRRRDLILSAILKLIQSEILPHLEQRTAYISVLNMQYRGHSKSRLNPYLALMMLILERLLLHWDAPAPTAQEIWSSWIETQNSMAKEHEVHSNDILKLLDGIIRVYRLEMDRENLQPTNVWGYDEKVYQYKHPEYGISVIMSESHNIPEDPEMTETIIEFETTSKDLVHAFSVYCKTIGITNPYNTASVFGSRLKNDKDLLKQGGWELITKDDENSHYKTVRGNRFYKFRHTLIR